MKNLGKVIAHIPARGGSQRVPRKNLKDINGLPMIAYSIKAAKKSQFIDELYVNSEDNEILKVGEKYGARPFKRKGDLASNSATSDQFNYDIIEKLSPDTLIMINPVCPLIGVEDIDMAISHYQKSDCDTLITSNSTKMQVFCEGSPVNIKTDEELKPTQENAEVHTLNWAITIWDASLFTKRFRELGYASLGSKRELFSLEAYKSIKVSYPEDFEFVTKLLQ